MIIPNLSRPRMSRLLVAFLSLGAAVAAALIVSFSGPILGIAVIAGCLALGATAFAPGVIFAAYLLIPFYKGAVQEFSPIDLTLVLAGLNALQIVPVILDRRRRSISRAGIGLWLALPILVLAGVLYGPNQSLALDDAAGHWALVVLPILPAALRVGRDARYVREFLWTFFGLAFVVVLLGVVQLSSSQRLVILGMNTIQAGRIALIVPLLGVAFVVWQAPRLVGLMAVMAIPLAIVVALATGSRGPLVALGVIGCFALARYLARPGQTRESATRVLAIAAASIAVVIIMAPILPAASTGRFTNLAEFIESGLGASPEATGETSAAARITLYSIAVSIFDKQPILGSGTGGFEALSQSSRDPTQGAYPHNAFLQIAAEFGLAGVVFFVAVVIVALTRTLPTDASAKAVRALFAFFLLNAMVSGDIISDRETLGVLMLVLVIEMPRFIGARVPVPDEPDAGFPSMMRAAPSP